MGGDGGCRVGEVRAGTTSPTPDHNRFKLQELVNFQKFCTLSVNTFQPAGGNGLNDNTLCKIICLRCSAKNIPFKYKLFSMKYSSSFSIPDSWSYIYIFTATFLHLSFVPLQGMSALTMCDILCVMHR